MTMGVKHRISSEYQRSFKSKYPCFTKVYEHNVDYRAQRRSTEHYHQVEPFLWDSTDSSENGSELSNCEQQISTTSLSVPRHIHKHEKYNKVYHDQLKNVTRLLERNLRVGGESNSLRLEDPPVEVQHEQTQTEPSPQLSDVNEAAEDEQELEPAPIINQVVKPPKHEKSSHYSRPKHPLQNKRAPKNHPTSHSKYIPKPRPISAPLGRPLSEKEKTPTDVKAPFVPYGFKDQKAHTAHKKTYNIRASADIYPSALLAQKRRQAMVSKREEDAKSASLKEKKKKALFNEFNEKVRRETAQWQTEYRSHYAGYEKGIYERSLSARPASRHQESTFLGATCYFFT